MYLFRGLASCSLALLFLAGCPNETDGTGAGGNGPSGPECEDASDCPKGPCESAACNSGSCALTPLEAGIVIDLQLAGDCQTEVCDGNGTTMQEADETDTPGGNECLTGICDGTMPTFEFITGGTCNDGNGFCVLNPQDDNPFNTDCVECLSNSDCATNICDVIGGDCSPETCGDLAKNNQETDVDCGGNECPRCAAGLDCQDDNDCLSDDCDNTAGTCN